MRISLGTPSGRSRVQARVAGCAWSSSRRTSAVSTLRMEGSLRGLLGQHVIRGGFRLGVASGDEAPLGELQTKVADLECAQAVSDHETGAARHEALHRLEDRRLGLHVHCARWL